MDDISARTINGSTIHFLNIDKKQKPKEYANTQTGKMLLLVTLDDFVSLQLNSFNLFFSMSMDFLRALCFVFLVARLPKIPSGVSLNLSMTAATFL